jgi:hypothetical protein
VLQEIDPQHPLHLDRRTAISGFGIERLDQPAQRAMIEIMPLEQASTAYARMMSGEARFRMVLTMSN